MDIFRRNDVAETKQKDTRLLQAELRHATNPEQFIKDNQSELKIKGVAEYLNELLVKYNLDVSAVAKRGGFAGNYAYQIFNGKKSAGRDKLIQIAIGFPLSIEETQELLRLGGYRELYVRNNRDAFILFAIEKKYGIQEINALLYDNNHGLLE